MQRMPLKTQQVYQSQPCFHTFHGAGLFLGVIAMLNMTTLRFRQAQ